MNPLIKECKVVLILFASKASVWIQGQDHGKFWDRGQIKNTTYCEGQYP